MKLNSDIKKDISISIESWQKMLNDYLPDDIEYIFTKGSSAKKWESEIDYVPIISDVDIHIKLKNNRKKILNFDDSFEQASFFTTNYPKLFFEKCKNENHASQHLPRIQLVQLDFERKKGYVVPPRESDIIWIQGKGKFSDEMDHEKVRRMDFLNLKSEESFIQAIPNTYMELSGLEYYTLLYRLNSRISPSPIRLLTQIIDSNPHDIWAYNKTTVKNKLIKNNLGELAEYYENYYILGWDLFKNNFTDIELYRNMIKNGYLLLKRCIEELEKIN